MYVSTLPRFSLPLRNDQLGRLAAACATPYNQNTVTTLLFLGCFCMGWTENNGLTISGIAITDQAKIGTAIGVGASFPAFNRFYSGFNYIHRHIDQSSRHNNS